MNSRQSTLSATAALVLLGTGACMVPPEEISTDPTLTDTLWQLQQIQYNNDTLVEPDAPENYTIEFMQNGEVGIQADCNRVLGTYTEDGSSISIELGPSTLAACPPGSIDTEYLQALEAAAIYFFQEGDLFIDMKFDTGTIQFSAAEEPPM